MGKGENQLRSWASLPSSDPKDHSSTTRPSCTCLLLDSRREFGRPEILRVWKVGAAVTSDRERVRFTLQGGD